MGSIQQPIALEALTPVKVLVIGGSYGGLSTALNLLDLCQGKFARFDVGKARPNDQVKTPIEIKIVDERDGYYHLIGSPLALASNNFSDKAWTKFTDVPALQAKEFSHFQGSVVSVDFEKKVAKIENPVTRKTSEEPYDYMVAASGLRRAWPVVPQSLSRTEYLAETNAHIEAVKNARDGVVVIGGGAVGIEMAAEVKVIYPTQNVTLIHSRDQLLSAESLPDDCKDRALVALKETGVKVILGHRVTETKTLSSKDGAPQYQLTLSDGSQIIAGHLITALSRSTPSTTYFPKEVLDEEGLVKINSNLQLASDVPNAAHHFAVGDLASWSGIKRCGSAMHMGHLTAINIHEQILEKQIGKAPKFEAFPEVPPMIALAVGKTAVVYDPEGGTKSGENLMKIYFEEDLGRRILWDYMQLSNDSNLGLEDVSLPKQISEIAIGPVVEV